MTKRAKRGPRKAKLKPCPHCGKQPRIHDMFNWYWIQCWCLNAKRKLATAARAWNRRTP